MENQTKTEGTVEGREQTNATSSTDTKAANRNKTSNPRRKINKGLIDIIAIAGMLVIAGGSIWLLYWLYTKLVSWVVLGGIGGFVMVALTCIVFGGFKEGLATFATIFLICVFIWGVIWFTESPEYRAGVNAYDEGDYATAIANFDLVIQKEPDHAEAYLKRCDALRHTGGATDALADCNRAIRLDYPFKEESYSIRGRVFTELGRFQEAIDDFSVASRVQPSAYDLVERGNLYNRLKRHKTALKDFNRALHLDKDYVWAYWGMGNALYSLNQRKAALTAYERYEKSGENMSKAMRARIDSLRKQFGAAEK